MFEKISEREHRDFLLKNYKYEVSFYEMLDMVMNSGLNFNSVRVYDSGDVGLKYFGGRYSYSRFCEMYDSILTNIDTVNFDIEEPFISIGLAHDDNFISLAVKDSTLEIEDLIKKNRTL